MNFEIVGPIHDVQTIASGTALRERKRLRRIYGSGRWRKLKGVALVRFSDGSNHRAEVHWYEAHRIGPKEHKIKYILD